MNINTIPSIQRNSDTVTQPSVIQLEQIKSILYLGMKGDLTVEQLEPHNIDTFA